MVGRPGAAYRPAVRVVSVLCALGVIFIYSSIRKEPAGTDQQKNHGGKIMMVTASSYSSQSANATSLLLTGKQRHLLSYNLGDADDNGGSDGDDDDNCSQPRISHPGYNDSCDFVLDQCEGVAQLFDYLKLVLCNLSNVQWLGYVILTLWLLYLISLLATTADNFFVPPLNLLSEKLRLSPSIAGITLLALGNGAPDVFTAYAGLKQDDMQLVLGALIGASIFISTVVLGTIIIVVNVQSKDIDKIDFFRDVVAYILVVGLVVGVAFDGRVMLFEAVGFLLFYILYIVVVVLIGFLRGLYKKWKEKKAQSSEKTPLLDSSIQTKPTMEERNLIKEVKESLNNLKEPQKPKLELLGLTWPSDSHIGGKIQFILEWPLSLLRWVSVPPCYYDGQWTVWHFIFAVVSPVPMATVLMIAAQGWSGFYEVKMGNKVPLFPFLVLIGLLLSVLLFFLLKRNRPPHWSLQVLLGIAAFVMSIAWLNIEANEVVAVLDSFGLLLNIDTGILGLTVLAIGNSVGDWVADTAVARAGKPGMGIASCFGSPLLNDVIGLSLALIARIASQGGKPFVFDIDSKDYLKVKMSWIFLGISLFSSIIIFPLFKFSPPKPFGVALIYLYVVFMIFSVLDETGHFNIDFLGKQ